MLNSADLYPLIDALGFPVKLGRRDGDTYPVTGAGSGALAVPSLNLHLAYAPTVVESHLNPADMQTTGLRVHVLGALELVLTYDHKRLRLEAFVVNGPDLPTVGVFGPRWSRLKFMFAVHKAVRAHYLWVEAPGGESYWQETPKAARWVLDYLQARETGKLSADLALELADGLAFELLDRDDPELHHKWAISSKAKRREALGDRA